MDYMTLFLIVFLIMLVSINIYNIRVKFKNIDDKTNLDKVNSGISEKAKQYINLLDLSYESAVAFLLDKYGPSEHNYFMEESYKKFMNGENKNICKGDYTRTKEGLYCHHIDEIKFQKMADKNFIKNQNISFEHQKKERLVYCDLVEHAILHTLIANETSNEFGRNGLEAFLIPNINKWYIDGLKPTRDWEINCYNKSYISEDDAYEVLDSIMWSLKF